MTQRKTIAIDIDDVLSKSAEGFIAFSNARWSMNLSPEDYDEEWAVVWGVPLEEALQRSVEFHASGAVGQYEVIDEALPALKRLKKYYNLVAVTSRRSILKPETDAWIERHFPGIFDELHYAGIWDNVKDGDIGHALKRTKAELLRELGAEYLIDDQLKHCAGAAGVGIVALLFAAQPTQPLPNGIVSVRNWDEVAEYFHV